MRRSLGWPGQYRLRALRVLEDRASGPVGSRLSGDRRCWIGGFLSRRGPHSGADDAPQPLPLEKRRRGQRLHVALIFRLGGTKTFLPFNLIWIQGYSATAAGAAIVPATLIMSLLSCYTGGLTDRYSPRLPLVLGPAIAAVGFFLFAVPRIGGSYWATFFPAAVVLGVGLSILVPAVTTVALNAVEASIRG